MQEQEKQILPNAPMQKEIFENNENEILNQLKFNHIIYLMDYPLTEKAFKEVHLTNFFTSRFEKESSLNGNKNGEDTLLDLLQEVRDKGYKNIGLTPDETKEGLKKMFFYLDANLPITAAPADENERKDFYQKISRGHQFIADLIKKEYQQNRMDEDQVFSCIQMIGEGGNYCAGRWRQVLDELFIGFGDRLKENGDKINVPADRLNTSIEESFFKARGIISAKLSNEFVDRFHPNVMHSERLHFVTYYQRYLNQKFNFNLPITMEEDPFLHANKDMLDKYILLFSDSKNINGMVLDKTIEILKDRIKEDQQFYERVVDFAKQIYTKNKLKFANDDVVEFLSENFFEGFSREIKNSALHVLLQQKKFIHHNEEPLLDQKRTSEYLKKIVFQGKWEEFDDCVRECGEFFDHNPLLNFSIEVNGGKIPVITLLVSENQLERVKEFIKMGADVNEEDDSSLTTLIPNLNMPVFGRRPLHIAVLRHNMDMLNLLLENGADPFSGKLVYHHLILNPFELSLRFHNHQVTSRFIDYQIEKDKDRMIRVPGGRMPFLNYLIAKRLVKSAEKLILKGANIHSKEDKNHPMGDVEDYTVKVVQGRTPLHFAVEKSDLPLIQLLLDKGVDPQKDKLQWNVKGQTILYSPIDYAVERCRMESLELILFNDWEKLRNHKVATLNGEISLFRVIVEKGEMDLVKKMVEAGVDIHKRDEVDQGTPLHAAVQMDRAEIASYLMEQGVNPFEGKAAFGRVSLTPFMFALRKRNRSMVDRILEKAEERGFSVKPIKGVKIFMNDGSMPILHYLIQKKYTSLARELILLGENVNEKEVNRTYSVSNPLGFLVDGRTSLLVAVKMMNKDIVQLLLEKGADPKSSIKTGIFAKENAFSFAKKLGNEEIVKLIDEYKVTKREKNTLEQWINFKI